MPCPLAAAAFAEARSCSRRYSADVGTHGSRRRAAVFSHMDRPVNSGWSGPRQRFHGLYLSSGLPPARRAGREHVIAAQQHRAGPVAGQ